ncbi:MAG: hypothetical protein AMJ43_02515 [Coxiella sp. DG_40]|nr:MAG: hypothetical protein AMJ43_02515 [Coxiella sp. DG_40]
MNRVITKGEKSEGEPTYPLSGIQKGLLFSSLYGDKAGVYVTQVSISFRERLNLNILQDAWNKVISRHEILRAGIFTDQGLLKIYNNVQCSLRLFDFSNYSPVHRKKFFSGLLQKEKKINFNLKNPLLMSIKVCKLANNDYRLIWSHHHAILAGNSIVLVLNEVFNIYDMLCVGQTINFKQPRSYADYVNYSKNVLIDKEKAYWRNLLSGFTQPSELLLPHKKPGNRHQKSISGMFSSLLKNKFEVFVDQNSLTMNLLIQAAWGLLLSKYSNADDIVFGTVCALPRVITDNLAGPFINTLPVRIKIEPSMDTDTYFQMLNQQRLMRRKYINTPLQSIQQWCDVRFGLQLFNSITDFKPRSLDFMLKTLDEKWKKRRVEFSTEIDYPLALEVFYEEKGLYYRLSYDAGIYDDVNMFQMVHHLKTILQNIVKDSNQLLSDITCLSKKELKTILTDWNDTYLPYSENKTIHKLFEEQVKKTPHNIAVVYNTQSYTYQELNQKSNQIGYYLRRLGVKAESLVAICVERSIEIILGTLGILKAGGAFVPIDPDYPMDRITYILNDINATILLTQKKWNKKVNVLKNIRIVFLDDVMLKQESIKNLNNVSNVNNLAYVIYTSGSTGKPKGVLIKHNGVINLALTEISKFDIIEKSRILNYASYVFDAAIWEWYSALFAGATLVIASKRNIASGDSLIASLQKYHITIVTLPPSALNSTQVTELTDLKTIIVAGEPCSSNLVARWGHSVSLINAYGPTESTVCATMKFCSPHDEIVTIGKPIPNVNVYVLDKYLQPVPISVIGELYIGGVGLARGYLNQSTLTKEKFIANPFTNKKDSRLYKTGDLVRWLPNGELEYIGRIDDQVKIRGFRIELNEVNTNLCKCPNISQTVTIEKEDDKGNKYLIAYLVCHDKSKFKVQTTRYHLKKCLPEYMIPDQFIILDSFPMTPNGKIDKKALSKMEVNNQEESCVQKTKLETSLTEVFKELLKCNNIETTRNFFEMGIHSFTLIQACDLLNARFNIKLKPVDLFTYSTIRSLANHINCPKQESSIFDSIAEKVKQKKVKSSIRRKRYCENT